MAAPPAYAPSSAPRGPPPAVSAFYTPVTLPPSLQGDATYIVVVHPQGPMYSISLRHVCQSEGARQLLERLVAKRKQKYRKPLHAALCDSAVEGSMCAKGWNCPHIHCTLYGIQAMRPWSKSPPQKPLRRPSDWSGSLSRTGTLGSGEESEDNAGELSSEESNPPSTPPSKQSQHTKVQRFSLPPAATCAARVGEVSLQESLTRLRRWARQRDGEPYTSPSSEAAHVHHPYAGAHVPYRTAPSVPR